MRAGAGIDRLELGVEGALPFGLERYGFPRGAAAACDVLQKTLSAERVRLNDDGLFPEIVGHLIIPDGLYPACFQSDGEGAIMRDGLKRYCFFVAGITPGRTCEHGNYQDCRNQVAHGGIIE